MEKGFVYQKWKLLLVKIRGYLGDGLAFVIMEFTETETISR